MTIRQPASNTAPPPAGAPARAGTPRRRLIILASAVLAVLAGVAAAVTALIPSAAPAAHGTARPLTGTGAGTMTLNLANGAATAKFTGHLSPLGAETGDDNDTVTLTGPSTFTYTGTRIFVAANGDKLFSAITGTGDLHPHYRPQHGGRHDHRRHRPLRRGQRDLHGHDQLRGRLGHRDQPDQPLHRCCPRTDPLLGQIGPGVPVPTVAGLKSTVKRARRSLRSGGFGYDQAVHLASRTRRRMSAAVSG